MPPGGCLYPLRRIIVSMTALRKEVPLETWKLDIGVSVEQAPARATALIVYGDPVVSQTLAMLLQTTNCRVNMASLSSLMEDPASSSRLLAEVQVLLLTPGLESERRDAFLMSLHRYPSLAKIPVLELGVPSEEALAEADYSAPWPSRTEDLIRRINAVLDAGQRREGYQDGQEQQT